MARHKMPGPDLLQGGEQGFVAQRPHGAGNLVGKQRPIAVAVGVEGETAALALGISVDVG